MAERAGTEEIAAAAARLRAAAASGVPCAPVRDLIGGWDQDAAYAVQRAVLDGRLADGARRVGHKIGLTSAAVQRQFGVHAPDCGVLLDSMVHTDREPLDLGLFLQPRIEAEVAFVLGRDLEGPWVTAAEVIAATDFLLPALEIADSRIADWDIRITDTVADNASGGAVVLGTTPRPLAAVDLPGLGMALDHRGETVSTGSGAACLGTPVAAVTWLARAAARRGDPLRAGDLVLSGALGPMVPVTGPGVFRARLDGLGEVHADLVRADAADATEGSAS
ncbi:fumarylacetoacetate hydrolase family protein [Streptomyces catenulae]|uniref:Fumarylacetoacetate hydrolase family protein n=1 Tax=Streptomyces catenulae TaxID=66875 RepID=A0ABV2Z3P2_9ACTN|nr:fumarylacetoacetate hydrolase family protein [Streptomyces catenulae]